MKKALVIIITLIFLFILSLMVFFYRNQNREIIVETNKEEYMEGELVTLKITNNTSDSICFSSCYPYFIETLIQDVVWDNSANWEREFYYSNCEKEDVIETCVGPKEIKGFQTEINMLNMEKGTYRIAIPYCANYFVGNLFNEESFIYSDIFKIK